MRALGYCGELSTLYRGTSGRHLAFPLKMLSLSEKRKFIMWGALSILIFNSEVMSSYTWHL